MNKADFNFDKFSTDIEIEPVVVAPLLNTTLTVKDFVSITKSDEADYIIEYGQDGLVSFNYRDTSCIETPITRGSVTVPVQGEIEIGLFRNVKSDLFSFHSVGATFISMISVNILGTLCIAKNIRLEVFDRNGNMIPINSDDEYYFSVEDDNLVYMLNMDISGDFFKLIPHTVKYSLDVEFDPDQFTGQVPDMIRSTCISTIHIPFHGYTEGLVIADTIDFGFTPMSEIDKADYLKMKVVFRNHFPSDITCNLVFLDENYQVQEKILASGHHIPASPVQNEISTGESYSEYLEQCDADRILILESCKYMVINATFKTIGAENKLNVKFIKDNYLGITLVITAKKKLHTNELF